MTGTDEHPVPLDPWAALGRAAGMADVPLEQVTRRLRLAPPDAQALKRDLLRQINRLFSDAPQQGAGQIADPFRSS